MQFEYIEKNEQRSRALENLCIGDTFVYESAYSDTEELKSCIIFIKIPGRAKNKCYIMDIDDGSVNIEEKKRLVIPVHTKLIVSLDTV